jgi:hypothetical protein
MASILSNVVADLYHSALDSRTGSSGLLSRLTLGHNWCGMAHLFTPSAHSSLWPIADRGPDGSGPSRSSWPQRPAGVMGSVEAQSVSGSAIAQYIPATISLTDSVFWRHVISHSLRKPRFVHKETRSRNPVLRSSKLCPMPEWAIRSGIASRRLSLVAGDSRSRLRQRSSRSRCKKEMSETR